LIAAQTGKTFAAPLLFAGTCNTTLFNAWREKELCPLLNDTHVVVMDNMSFQKSAKPQALIRSFKRNWRFFSSIPNLETRRKVDPLLT